ncbi:MAG: RMD1 family protein [Hyphomonadaceae bacterium]|nr:MAG: hypothetical protein FD160_1431 [Caulobacteraceae bacterium]MBT9447292.1 RMD1 family protein [Hyphomonadaceae bacterium]TPW08297.1 MAG: hypothetical protein FD124_518 [Alphaproteobacteria bacterium]
MDARHTLIANATLLGERLDLRGHYPPDMVSQTPLAYRPEGAPGGLPGGLVVLFRFGAIVCIGLEPVAEAAQVEAIHARVVDPFMPAERETLTIVAGGFERDHIMPGGGVGLPDASTERLLVVADALAKSVALAQDERQITTVFDRIEPFARDLSASGGGNLTFKALLAMLGDALAAQARMVGRVEVGEKPDVLWDRPDLQRLHTTLDDEYELRDRARALTQKLKVIEECATAFVAVADARRAHRLEWAIIILIMIEIGLTLMDFAGWVG